MRSVTVRVPGDKSITHRALLFSSLAQGESRIRGALDAADTRSTASVLRLLGVNAPSVLHDEFRIQGGGLRGWTEPVHELDCGNSGTTARLTMGALAGLPLTATLTGDASLSSRPMRRVTTPLAQMGARFDELGAADRLPIRVHGGGLTALEHFSPQSSAQVKSALMLAALTGDVRVTVTEPRLSRDHSERMLAAMGARVERSIEHDGTHTVTVNGATMLAPLDVQVPGDFSSAAFFIACALLLDDVEVHLPGIGLNPGRAGMLDVVRRMNAVVDVSNERTAANEPVGDLRARHAELSGTTIDGAEVPGLIDEIPMIAALAARAHGETRITGASELRVKETDRIRAMADNLQSIGVAAEELADGIVVHGTQAPLRGVIRAHGDHRIAMAFGVLGALPGNDITIDDPHIVAVSFPGFWNALADVQSTQATR